MATSHRRCFPLTMRVSLVFLSLAFFTISAQTSTVKATTPPLIVTEPPKLIAFLEGEAIELPCFASGEPSPTYKWTKDDEEFDPTGSVTMSSGFGTLIFSHPDGGDEGVYQCMASNEGGTAVTVKVQLRRAMLEPFESLEITYYQPHLGHALTLRCNPPWSFPTADIFWAIISEDERMTPIGLTDRVTMDDEGSLHIANVLKYDGHDGNRYACIAQNTVMRRVQIGEYAVIQPQGQDIQHSTPKFMWHSSSRSVALRGQTWKFKCIFSGSPTPRVDWVRIGGAMPTRSRQESFGQELVIEDVQLEDDGTYECRGINDEAMVPITRRRFELNVESGPFWTKGGRPMSVDSAEDDRAEFVCETEAIPESDSIWYFNGVPSFLAPENPDRVIEGNKLIFLNMTMEDTQVIQCNSSNQYGYEWQNAYLNVIPKRPTIADYWVPFGDTI